MIFNIDNIQAFIDELKNGLKFPFVYVQYSTLGGKENISVIVTISKEAKENWKNGILENSQYAHIHIYNSGIVENFSGHNLKLRKFKANNVKKIIEKINNIKVVEYTKV